MVISINANPGQTLSLAINVLKTDGTLSDGYIGSDGYAAPNVDSIFLPNSSYAANFPAAMTEISTGIWKYTLVLPSGASSIGTYIASISWFHPDTGLLQNEIFLICVFLPFGNSSVSPG